MKYRAIIDKFNTIVSSDVTRKTVLLKIVCLTGIVFLLPMGLLAMLQHNYYLWLADWVLASILAGSLFYLRRGGKLKHAITVNITLMMVFFFFLLSSGGVNNTAFVWCYVFPLFSLFLLGPVRGALVNLIFLVLILAFLLVEPRILNFTTYSADLKLRFIPSYLVVLLYAFVFEYMGKIYFENLRDRNAKLEKVVAELTRAREDLIAAKQSAEMASRTKSEFLANMSHELRTPLNHIIGFTELVLSGDFGRLSAEQEEFLKDVLGSGHHLLSLINDVLDLAKVEAGKMELALAPVRIRELLENSLVMVKEKALKHQLQLKADVDGLPEEVLVDERKLKQVVYNLLSNAVKFTPQGGQVRLEARIQAGSELDGCPVTVAGNGHGQWLSVWVADTGIGLAPEDLARVFSPFEQVEGSASRKYQGTGLGLSLTRQMVALHGGAIWAESAGTGQGSTFRFAIPLAEAPAAESAAP
ncbi:MAG: ATP-binding protein [Desulfobacterales bacterium]|nr:ATP-binding protein [Desulfobacterales bacterium]